MAPIISLEGKRILITGGARGLGQAFAEAAIAAGAQVAIADILEEVGADAAKKDRRSSEAVKVEFGESGDENQN